MFISKPQQTTQAAVEERRRSIRHTAINQVAKIRLGSGREELCLLRDISAEGARAEVYLPLKAGAAVDVELRTAHMAAGRVAWTTDNEIGIAFDAPIPAAAMLAHCSFEENGTNLRPPRLKVSLRGLLRIGSEARMANIGNISLAGLQIEAPERLGSGVGCSIALPRLPARSATICWWRDGHAGLMLAESFDYPAFARWRMALR